MRGTAKELRAKHWKLQAQAGVDLIPSNDFSYYDQMLDTAILLNVIPQRYKRLAFTNPEETLFAMGRGYQGDKGDVTASTAPSRSTSSTRQRPGASSPNRC